MIAAITVNIPLPDISFPFAYKFTGRFGNASGLLNFRAGEWTLCRRLRHIYSSTVIVSSASVSNPAGRAAHPSTSPQRTRTDLRVAHPSFLRGGGLDAPPRKIAANHIGQFFSDR